MNDKPLTRPNKSGSYLRAAREALGLSIEDVAEAVGRKPRTVASWERLGIPRRMMFSTFCALADTCHVNMERLADLALQPAE